MGNQIGGLCCYDADTERMLDTEPERRTRKQYKIARKGDKADGSDNEQNEDETIVEPLSTGGTNQTN